MVISSTNGAGKSESPCAKLWNKTLTLQLRQKSTNNRWINDLKLWWETVKLLQENIPRTQVMKQKWTSRLQLSKEQTQMTKEYMKKKKTLDIPRHKWHEVKSHDLGNSWSMSEWQLPRGAKGTNADLRKRRKGDVIDGWHGYKGAQLLWKTAYRSLHNWT